MNTNLTKWLQEWFTEQCDGEWEHEHGIRIHNSDNPGWCIEIDIIHTGFNKDISSELFEISEHDWFFYKIKDNYFHAYGDASKLEFLLQLFKDFIEKGEQALPIWDEWVKKIK